MEVKRLYRYLSIWATLVDMPTTSRSAPAPANDGFCCPGAGGELIPPAEADALAEVFKALADPTRIRLLRYLAESAGGTACACHLPDALGISQPTLSFHLRKLLDAGLVTRERRGRWVHWTVRPDALTPPLNFMARARVEPAECC